MAKVNKKLLHEIKTELQQYDWYNELPDDIKEMAIEQEYDRLKPIEDLDNCFMDIALISPSMGDSKQKWEKARSDKFPYLEAGSKDNQMVRRFKRQWLSDNVFTDPSHPFTIMIKEASETSIRTTQ